MHREGGTFEELPAYDLAMQSNAAVVLDHGTDIFIWLVCFCDPYPSPFHLSL
jgi:hypothetical protein